ncbi:sulfonate ABC transporter permease [Pseudolabrys sp. Root1462]|jgi:NitT/TauT family transport system permease protein|uniref:ABC transporter permease n=1 Tax=Pseudolabrys sp. Root1462 TaxID=1736466 RepID=UPI0007036205|nr:ABC transporter permease [Pseudolabrys sp. Root1462]KQZ00056.1 sulfonate ABC transporter permease [Pseudolabrys sp. Root1462]
MSSEALVDSKIAGQGQTAPSSRSAAYEAYLRALRWRAWSINLWQIGLVAVFLVAWEVAPRAGWINPMLTSYPSAVARTFMASASDGTLLMHTWVTLSETIIGFAGGMFLGLLCAIALWWSDYLYRVLDPFIVVLNAIPKIALVPIFYIWLGDAASIYAMAIAVSVFVTVLMLFTGFKAIDPDKVKLARLFGASKRQILDKIVLPGSVPTIISALKVNVGLALVGVIVGEFQAAKAGLGYLITYGSQIFQMNLVMTAIVVLAMISTVLFAAIQAIEATVLRRHGVSR